MRLPAILAGDERAIVPDPIFGPKLDYIDSTLLFPKTWTRLTCRGRGR